MITLRLIFVLGLSLSGYILAAQSGFSFVDKKSEKKIVLRYDGKPITAYCYFDSTEKPVLYPVRTLSGVTVTRGFPIAPRHGERADHPHHTGLWFNYESVNGLDFWNNSSAIAPERKASYGSIAHKKVLSSSAEKDAATLKVLSQWEDHQQRVLLIETTEFNFRRNGNNFIIDRIASLEAVSPEVVFKDVKDGLIGIRVARSLEMPSAQMDYFIDSQGRQTEEKALNNQGVTGMYVNREGVRGDEVWASSSPWVQLYGYAEDKPVSITIIDHPDNPGYPTYWHARGYGLFAANPLGREVFSKGQEQLNLTLKKGEARTFRYRIVIHDGEPLTSQQIDSLMAEFHDAR